MNKVIKFAFISFLFLFIIFPVFFNHAKAQPKVLTDTYTSSKVCGNCHKDIYNKWKNSTHSHAISDPIFDAAYTKAYRLSGGQAKYICLRCHAPTVSLTKDYDMKKAITHEGVTCDFCHSIKGIDLSDHKDPYQSEVGLVKRGPMKDSKTEDHKSEYSSLHEKSKFCAGCHDYRSDTGALILGTYSEWKEGPYAKKGLQCQHCHMPLAKGEIAVSPGGNKKRKKLINEHNLIGGHSITQVKKALDIKIISVKREANHLEVLIDITNKGSGHKVPTGIPSRKLVLKVTARTASGKTKQHQLVYEKVLVDKNGVRVSRDSEIMLGKGIEISKDNRIGPKETRRESFAFYGLEDEEAAITAIVEYRYTPVLAQPVEMKIEMGRDERVTE